MLTGTCDPLSEWSGA